MIGPVLPCRLMIAFMLPVFPPEGLAVFAFPLGCKDLNETQRINTSYRFGLGN